MDERFNSGARWRCSTLAVYTFEYVILGPADRPGYVKCLVRVPMEERKKHGNTAEFHHLMQGEYSCAHLESLAEYLEKRPVKEACTC